MNAVVGDPKEFLVGDPKGRMRTKDRIVNLNATSNQEWTEIAQVTFDNISLSVNKNFATFDVHSNGNFLIQRDRYQFR
jgi:hypothetical protein